MHVKEIKIGAVKISMHILRIRKPSLLTDGRSHICVKRVNAPVPDCSDESADTDPFHYVSSQ